MLTAFRMKFSQLIDQSIISTGLQPGVVPPTFAVNQEFVNAGSATDEGLELTAKWLLNRTWSIGGNATFLNYTLDGSGQTPTYVPKKKVNLWTRYANGRFNSYLAFQHVDSVMMQAISNIGPSSRLTERPAIDQLHVNLGWELLPGLVMGAYARNALKHVTLQGAGGAVRSGYDQGARREIGGTVAYRF